MSACAPCVSASLVRSGALGAAERVLGDARATADLLRMEPAEMAEQLARFDAAAAAEVARRTEQLAAGGDGVWTLCEHGDAYPEGLRLLADRPRVLYCVGDRTRFARFTREDGVAIVGARRASAYGREVAGELARELAVAGLTVVSGMALGIDGAAHRGALAAGGATLAVLAGGPDTAYPPSHRRLYAEIAERGCVVSENPPRAQARRWAFPARNRIIAGLARMTVIVEGTEKSGARHTIEFAEQVDAHFGAVPGPVTSPLSALPNEVLRRDGAVVVRGADDVLDELSIAFRPAQAPPDEALGLSSAARTVLECVAAGEGSPQAVGKRLPDFDPRAILRELGSLELAGLIRREPSGGYIATTRAVRPRREPA